MRIAFFGTPEFAVPTLRALAKTSHTLAVFTQPDRPVGRKAILTPPPVKAAALELGLPVYQFEKIRSAEGCAAIRDFAPDLYAVVAFGQLFSDENLAIPPLGAINVHGSLLPLYRGASPMQQTVIDGQKTAGVSTMKLVKRMDAGDILMKAETPLGVNETYGELAVRLADMGADLFIRTLDALEHGQLVSTPQEEDKATFAHKIAKTDGLIDWSKSSDYIERLLRAYTPWPGCYTFLPSRFRKKGNTGRVVITGVEFAKVDPSRRNELPGTVLEVTKRGPVIRTGTTALLLTALKPEGAKEMAGGAFLSGRPLEPIKDMLLSE